MTNNNWFWPHLPHCDLSKAMDICVTVECTCSTDKQIKWTKVIEVKFPPEINGETDGNNGKHFK